MTKIVIFSFFLLSILASCVSRVEKSGYVFEISDIDLLQEGFSSQDHILQMMGSPTLIDDFSEKESWIYISEDIESFLFFKPKITSRNIVVLRFDDKNLLSKIEKFNHENEVKDLTFISKYTNVKSQKVGFFKSLFSNVGQIRSQ